MKPDMDNLMPEFRELIEDFVIDSNFQGFHVDVFCAYRDPVEQQRLYTLGRTEKNPDGYDPVKKPLGNTVTNAKGWYSFHNYGIAADVVFRDKNNKFTWNVPDNQWHMLAAIANAKGLEWGGNWHGVAGALGDTDHFQLTRGLKIEEAIKLGSRASVWNEIRRRKTHV